MNRKLLKLTELFLKQAQSKRRIVYDRQGIRPRELSSEVEETTQEPVIETVDHGAEWRLNEMPEYTEEDFKDFHIPVDFFEPEVQKSYSIPEAKIEKDVTIEPSKKKEEEQRLRKELLKDDGLTGISRHPKVRDELTYSKMLERERADREARQKEMEQRRLEAEMRERELRALQEEAFKKEPWKYYRNELGILVPKDPEAAKSIKKIVTKYPWKYSVDSDGNLIELSKEEAELAKKKYQAKKEEENILKKQKLEEKKEQRKSWRFEDVSNDEIRKRYVDFINNNPGEAAMAKALQDFIKKTKETFNKLNIETTFKKPTPKKSRTEQDKYRVRDEMGTKIVSVERPGQIIEDWVDVPVKAFIPYDDERAVTRTKIVHVKINPGTRTVGKRQEYIDYITTKVQEYYDAIAKLAEIKHKHKLWELTPEE